MVGPVTRTASSPSTSGNRGRNAYEVAKQFLGQNAAQLKIANSDVGLAMNDGVPNNVNCANFVSGVLEAAGQVDKSQHSDSAAGFAGNLGRDPNFENVSIENAKPGDVVLMNTGSSNHIVIFAGRTPEGKPLFIGSNNVNADGSQRVTTSQMNYRIVSVHHFKGGPEVVGATEGAAPSSGLPTGGSDGASRDTTGYSGPSTNKFSYGYEPPAPGSKGPVLSPGDTPYSAAQMTMDELMAWVENNLWQKMHARIAEIDADPAFKKFLEKKGVKPGEKITNAMRKEFLAEQLGREMDSRSGADKDVDLAADALLDRYAPEGTGSGTTTEPAAATTEGESTTEGEATTDGAQPATEEAATAEPASMPLTFSRYTEPMRA